MISAAVKHVVEILAPVVRSKRDLECEQLRGLLKPVIGDSINLNAKTIASIVRGVDAEVKAGRAPPPAKLDKSGLDKFIQFSTRDKTTKKSEQILQEVLSNTSNSTSWVVSRLMKRLKREDPKYFSYMLHYDDHGKIDGVIWQEGRTRAALQQHGKRGFWDMRVTQEMNELGYVYGAWVVLDGNNQFIPGCEGLLFTECDELYEFLLLGGVNMTPGITVEDVELGFGDDKVKPEKIREYFPRCVVMLDTYHFLIGNKGISILSKDFGAKWTTVKDHFHHAVYAKSEEECLVC